MADWVHVQQGDLDDAATVSSVVGHENLGDYVHNGLEITNADFGAETFDTTAGKVFVLLPSQYATQQGEDREFCLVAVGLDARTGITFDSTTVNHVYVRANINTNDSPVITVTQTEQSYDDGFKFAEIDGPNTTYDDTLADGPDGTFNDVVMDNLSVNDAVTYPDGTTRTGAPLTSSSTLDNLNEYYDDTATSPPGKVRSAANADHATSADSATNATNASNADFADDADKVDGYEAQEIIDQASDAQGAWTKLTSSPLVDSNTSDILGLTFNPSTAYDRYLVTVYVENHHGGDNDIEVIVNGYRKQRYKNLLMLEADDGRWDDHEGMQLVTEPHWHASEVNADQMATVEFTVNCPEPVASPDYHYPTYAMVSNATSADTEHALYGQLTKSFDTVNRLRVETDSDATGKMVVRGQDIV